MDRAFNIDSDSEHSEFDAEIAEMSESEDDEKDAEIEELPQVMPCDAELLMLTCPDPAKAQGVP